jgi:hypothetical protein
VEQPRLALQVEVMSSMVRREPESQEQPRLEPTVLAAPQQLAVVTQEPAWARQLRPAVQ